MKTKKEWVKQLTRGTLIKKVTFVGFDLELHIVAYGDSPDVFKEINRISAKRFGLKKDGDVFDKTYKYICVYDPIHKEINGFYRYILCRKAISAPNFHTSVRLATAKFYNFSKDFLNNILPYTIEFGRSVVNDDSYFERETKKTLHVLWMGLAIFVEEYYNKKRPNGTDPIIKWFFGKFSLQDKLYNKESINLILQYFKRYCGVSEDMKEFVIPKKEFELKMSEDYTFFNGINKEEAEKKLIKFLQAKDEPVPKLAFRYANLLGMKVWKPIWNAHLDSWEMAMIIDVSKILDRVLSKFMGDYKSQNHPVFKDI